ncbi:MAG: TetR/AcrR family transcriptional regulator [Lachnospiraceae bacterium]|nr:TetR/AcrR family transcriptional regulator [Lachnospiraceae bacterium]
MGLVDEKKRKKQQELLASAFSLFTEKGINETSISDIVNKAKMAKGTFYLYFKDKYDIRDRLITHHANIVFANANRMIRKKHKLDMSKPDALERYIVAITDNIIDQLNENKVMMRFISKNLSWGVFSNIKIEEMDNKSCMEVMEEMIRLSGRKFRNTQLLVFMIVELVNSTCFNVILNQQPVTVKELKKELNLAICGLIKQFEILPE